MLLSTVPLFLLIADGYYQKDLKKGVTLFFLCLGFIVVGSILAAIFKFKLIFVGLPIVIIAFAIAHFKNKKREK